LTLLKILWDSHYDGEGINTLSRPLPSITSTAKSSFALTTATYS
jgi:hypothetical protein